MLDIRIKTIPHSSQSYDTVGDYVTEENGYTRVIVSELDNTDYEFLVAIHELIELYLTQKRGILEEDITKFDKDFEELRLERPDLIGDMEPGFMTSAPYTEEHTFATLIEKIIAKELEVNWKEYEDKINSLTYKQ